MTEECKPEHSLETLNNLTVNQMILNDAIIKVLQKRADALEEKLQAGLAKLINHER